MTMNDYTRSRDTWNDRLSEYLDGELDDRERTQLEHHLQTCVTCRSDLEALRAVVARAHTLQDSEPDIDLWPSIAGRIGQARPERRSDTTSRRFSFTLPQLVAASLALMLASGGMVWLARLGGPGTDFPPATASIRPANFADRVYQQAVDDLQRTLDAGRDKLDPQTVRILEQNLSAIDAAIVQCREALEADPANLYLNTYLAEARTRKLDLLRRAAAIVDSSS